MTKHILNDKEIKELAEKENIIEPFIDHQVEEGVISYGLGSYGFDIRISNKFKVFSDVDNITVDPKDFSSDAFVQKEVEDSILIPPNSFALGVTVEKFNMPKDVSGVVFDKSTYRRCGILVSGTVIEPSWRGFLVVEISNTTPLPAKVYANEGIGQVVFFKGNPPNVTYDDKRGKYQDQEDKIQPAKVINNEKR